MRRLPLLAVLAVAALLAGACGDDDSSTGCDNLGELEATCYCEEEGDVNCDAEWQSHMCEDFLASEEFRDSMQCILDCDPQSCSALDECGDECSD